LHQNKAGMQPLLWQLAPFDTRPSAIKAASSVIVPTLIFAGSNDCITPPEKHQLPVYNSSASPDKIYIPD